MGATKIKQLAASKPHNVRVSLDDYNGKYMTHEVCIRNPRNPKREPSFLEKKNISCIKISKQLYKIDFNLT